MKSRPPLRPPAATACGVAGPAAHAARTEPRRAPSRGARKADGTGRRHPFAHLADELSDAMRKRHGRQGRDDFARFVIGDAPYNKRHVARVSFRGVEFSDDGAAEVYEVTPQASLDRGEAARWRNILKRWEEDPVTWRVAQVPGGAYAVRKAVPIKELRRRLAEYVNDEAARELPYTLSAPVLPAAPLTGEAVRLIVGKVGSRAAGAVPFAALRSLVESLPGWSWEGPAVVLRPMVDGHTNSRDDRAVAGRLNAIDPGLAEHPKGSAVYVFRRGSSGPDHATDADLAAIRAAFPVPEGLAAVGDDVQAFDDTVTDAPVGTVVVGGVDRVHDSSTAKNPIMWGSGIDLVRIRRVWMATPAWIVRAPDGSAFALYRMDVLYPPTGRRPRNAPEPDTISYDESFWPWAYRRGLGDLSERLLGSLDEFTLRRMVRMGSKVSLDNTAECQLCANVQKLVTKGIPGTRVMVDHGYTYPDSQGWRGGLLGERAGSCEGVGHLPYEKSCDLVKRKLAHVNLVLSQQEAFVASLRAKLAARTQSVTVPATFFDRYAPKGSPDVEVPPSHPRWADAMEARVESAKLDVREIRRYARWLAASVANWEPRPLYDELPESEKGR